MRKIRNWKQRLFFTYLPARYLIIDGERKLKLQNKEVKILHAELPKTSLGGNNFYSFDAEIVRVTAEC